MKILLAGGGTGGHFFPIIAVAEALYDLSEEEQLLKPEIIFMSDVNFDPDMLERQGIAFKKIHAGKIRRYFSLLNVTDIFKTFLGILKNIWVMYHEMPDVVFAKGGYASFPPLFAARIFRIPVIIHESDGIPGKVNAWASKFAKKIAISFPETAKYFPQEKVALTGIPVRKQLLGSNINEAKQIFHLENNLPTILVLGGSQGAQIINDIMISSADELTAFCQIIHQCGEKNEKEVKGTIDIALEGSIFKERYHVYGFMNTITLKNAFTAADVVVSRAGGSGIFEIAARELPSILIPLENSAQDHQKVNAYSYARTGAAMVVEQSNLSEHILVSEIKRLLDDKIKLAQMKSAAKNFGKPDSARRIAQAIIDLALEHA